MAAQPTVGLLPERRARPDTADCDHPDASGSVLARGSEAVVEHDIRGAERGDLQEVCGGNCTGPG